MVIIYGGAFNPPTKAHYEIIKTVNELLKPEAFIVIPVGNLYHKDELVPFLNRYDMLNLYKEELPFIEISRIEENQQFKGTVETLEVISRDYDKQNIALLIGTDQYLNFDKWIKYKEILEKYQLIVITRPGYHLDEKKYDEFKPNIKFIELSLDISSTQVRENLDLNKNALTESVYEYIMTNKLYRR